MHIDSKIILVIAQLIIALGKEIYKELENGKLSLGIMDGQVFIRGDICGHKINHSVPLSKVGEDIKSLRTTLNLQGI